MARNEFDAVRRGLRLQVVMAGAGWDVNYVMVTLRYGSKTSVYRLLNGEQVINVDQADQLAKAAAGRGEWENVKSDELLLYLLGRDVSLQVGRPSPVAPTGLSAARLGDQRGVQLALVERRAS